MGKRRKKRGLKKIVFTMLGPLFLLSLLFVSRKLNSSSVGQSLASLSIE